jgi:hypothetical protein
MPSPAFVMGASPTPTRTPTATATATPTVTRTSAPTPTILLGATISNAPPSAPIPWLNILASIGFLLVLLWLLLLLVRRRGARPRAPALQPI